MHLQCCQPQRKVLGKKETTLFGPILATQEQGPCWGVLTDSAGQGETQDSHSRHRIDKETRTSAMCASKGQTCHLFFQALHASRSGRPGDSPSVLCAVCSLRNRGTVSIDSHPCRGQARCGCNYLFSRTTVHSRVNGFLSLHEGFSPPDSGPQLPPFLAWMQPENRGTVLHP